MITVVRVQAYLISTFFKTLFLVISFGLLHSLVFLPVALTVLLPPVERLHKRSAAAKRSFVFLVALVPDPHNDLLL